MSNYVCPDCGRDSPLSRQLRALREELASARHDLALSEIAARQARDLLASCEQALARTQEEVLRKQRDIEEFAAQAHEIMILRTRPVASDRANKELDAVLRDLWSIRNEVAGLRHVKWLLASCERTLAERDAELVKAKQRWAQCQPSIEALRQVQAMMDASRVVDLMRIQLPAKVPHDHESR